MQGQVSTIFTASDGREYVIGPDRQVWTAPVCGRRGGQFDAGEHRCDILATFSGQDPIVLELKVRKPTKSDRVQAGAPLRQVQRGANAGAVEKVHGRSQARAQVWGGGCAYMQGPTLRCLTHCRCNGIPAGGRSKRCVGGRVAEALTALEAYKWPCASNKRCRPWTLCC